MGKRLLLLCFVCFLFAGSQMSFAQKSMEQQKQTIQNAESSVKKNAQKVINVLEREAKLDATQKNKVYDIFMAVDRKLKNIEAIEDANERKEKQVKMQSYINEKLQQVLTSKQYEIYLKKMSAK